MTPRDARLRRQYGVSEAEYDHILAWQGGGCALCGAFPKTTNLPFDHDHKTGRGRGILCHRCNRSLREHMGAEWVAKLMAYLTFPPAEAALGRIVQGRAGRITNKRRTRRRRA